MDFKFSFIWVLVGVILITVGVLMLKFYTWIAENLLSGVSSYARIKLASLITIGVGIAAATNLIPLIMNLLVGVIFGGSRI